MLFFAWPKTESKSLTTGDTGLQGATGLLPTPRSPYSLAALSGEGVPVRYN